MQCKPVTALPAGEKWTFDIKLDGYRCIVLKLAKEVTLFSRRQKVLSKRVPNVVEALASLEGDFVLDGELVALDSPRSAFVPTPAEQYLSGASNLLLHLRFPDQDGELLVNLPLLRRA
jgi:ATP-dependent DNA ligase